MYLADMANLSFIFWDKTHRDCFEARVYCNEDRVDILKDNTPTSLPQRRAFLTVNRDGAIELEDKVVKITHRPF